MTSVKLNYWIVTNVVDVVDGKPDSLAVDVVEAGIAAAQSCRQRQSVPCSAMSPVMTWQSSRAVPSRRIQRRSQTHRSWFICTACARRRRSANTSGAAGDVAESPSADDTLLKSVTVHVLADGFTTLSVAADVCKRAGIDPLILSSSVRFGAHEAAKTHVAVVEGELATGNSVEPPAAIVLSDETTVTIRSEGTGAQIRNLCFRPR